MKEHCDSCGSKQETRTNATQVRCVRGGHFIRRRTAAERQITRELLEETNRVLAREKRALTEHPEYREATLRSIASLEKVKRQLESLDRPTVDLHGHHRVTQFGKPLPTASFMRSEDQRLRENLWAMKQRRRWRVAAAVLVAVLLGVLLVCGGCSDNESPMMTLRPSEIEVGAWDYDGKPRTIVSYQIDRDTYSDGIPDLLDLAVLVKKKRKGRWPFNLLGMSKKKRLNLCK